MARTVSRGAAALRVAAAVFAVALAAGGARAAIFSVAGFEAENGYTTGPLHGQNFWNTCGRTDVVVQDQDAAEGTQALQITPDGSYDFDNPAFHLAAEWYFDPELAYGADIWAVQTVKIEALNEADYVVGLYCDACENVVTNAVHFVFNGEIHVNGADTGYHWTPGIWQNLELYVSHEMMCMSVWYGESLIAECAPFINEGWTDHLALLTDDYIKEAASSMYYDGLTVAANAEPATVLLVALGVGLVRWHRAARAAGRTR